jgi:hypothetical protein
MLHLTLVVLPDPLVELHTANPESYNRAELYAPIAEFVTALFQAKHQVCYLSIPLIEAGVETPSQTGPGDSVGDRYTSFLNNQ